MSEDDNNNGKVEWWRTCKKEPLDKRSAIYHIGPEVAAQVLSWQRRNRPLRPHTVAKYVRRMREGKWTLTQPMLLNLQNEPDDGQHRLHAIIEYGKPVPTVVLWGAWDYRNLDQPAPRTVGDALVEAGFKTYYNELGAAARLVIKHDRASAEERSLTSVPTRKDRPWDDMTNSEVISWLGRNKAILSYVQKAKSASWSTPLFSPSVITAILFLTTRIDEQEGLTWVEGLVTGANLRAGDVRLALRRKRERDRADLKRMGTIEVFNEVLKAWNQRELKDVKVFVYKNTEAQYYIR